MCLCGLCAARRKIKEEKKREKEANTGKWREKWGLDEKDRRKERRGRCKDGEGLRRCQVVREL